MDASLVATLGSAPQVIALGALALRAQGIPLAIVRVVSTSSLGGESETLAKHFSHHHPDIDFSVETAPVDDVLTQYQFDQYAQTLYTVMRGLVAKTNVHLLVAGGRKPMALVALSVAHLLLGDDDHVWYLHSSKDLRLSTRMTALPGDVVELVKLPHAYIGLAPPRYTFLDSSLSPEEARAALATERERHLHQFVLDVLTEAERELAALIATEVLSTAEMASRLHKSPKTITNQLNIIYSKMENHFGLDPNRGLKREFLRKEVARHL